MRMVEGETVILDRKGGLIHHLNGTAAYIWNCCDGQSPLEGIIQYLTEAFDVDATTATTAVAAMVGQLRQLHLLEIPEGRVWLGDPGVEEG